MNGSGDRTLRLLAVVVVPDRVGPATALVPLAGVPVLVHSIVEAATSAMVAKVVVSTSEPEVAAVARLHGADVVERDVGAVGAGDGPDLALAHVVDHLDWKDGPVVVLDPAMPLRPPGLIDAAVRRMAEAGADSLFSSTPIRGVARSSPGAEPVGQADIIENGALHVFEPSVLHRRGTLLGDRVATISMEPFEALVVDGPDSAAVVERLWTGPVGRVDPRLAAIDLLLLDFDGVLTDNAVTVAEDGTESVRVDRGDGWGVARLRDAGVEMMIVSTERNPVVAARARKLRIPCLQAIDDKATAVSAELAERGVDPARAAFVGNDVNDLGAFDVVGLRIAVADARPELLARADVITARRGGNGAVREVADRILAARSAAPDPG